jgi:short-subunit dehydrogenase
VDGHEVDAAEGEALTKDPRFVDRYGPWGLIAGASEGVGAAYARAIADRGLNVVLLARRQEVLDEVASGIRSASGVQTRTLAIDLSEPNAAARVLAGTAGLEVGMFMYGAGADPNYELFLDQPVADALRLVQRNCMTPLELCHVFAASMVTRGKGGIVLVSSGAGFAGARNMVAYGASKAFDTVMGESLWAELHEQGVNVLVTVLGATDTPAFRRTLTRRGLLPDPDDGAPIPGTATPEEVVTDVLANLTNGPTLLVGERVREGSKMLRALTRSDAVRAMVAMSSGGIMETGSDEEATP